MRLYAEDMLLPDLHQRWLRRLQRRAPRNSLLEVLACQLTVVLLWPKAWLVAGALWFGASVLLS